MTTAHRQLGTLSFAAKHPSAYDGTDVDFLRLVANQVAVAVENALAFEAIAALKDQLAKENAYLEQEVCTEHNFGEIVGDSAALRQTLKQVETVAPTGSTVLIRGETGTGKELIARALHELSPRKDRTFVKMNCEAIPTGLLESELFGHEKGAFTGAIAQKVGRFELAHQGTLFLDEVGDIPLELQPKLLRVLQELEFERLGGTKTIKVDVRLVAATHRDLAKMVADGRFREDLYYRLNVFPVALPPLRERRDDIPRLVRHFTQQFARRMGRRIETIPSAALDALVRYAWPGNVRELQNIIERAVILSPGPSLQVPPNDLPAAAEEVSALTAAPVMLADAEREHILAALRDTDWLKRLRDGKSDLIVMAAHRHGRHPRFGSGSEPDELIRRAGEPVPVVQPGETAADILPEPALARGGLARLLRGAWPINSSAPLHRLSWSAPTARATTKCRCKEFLQNGSANEGMCHAANHGH